MFKPLDDKSFSWVVLRREPPSHSKFGLQSRPMMPHTPKGYEKAYYLHNWVFWREWGRRPNQVQSGLRTQERSRLGLCIVDRGWGQREGPHMVAPLVCFSSPTHTEGESTLAFLSACPPVGRQGEKEMRLMSWHLSNTKNRVSLLARPLTQDSPKQADSLRPKAQGGRGRGRVPERISAGSRRNECLPGVVSSCMEALWPKDPQKPNVSPKLKTRRKAHLPFRWSTSPPKMCCELHKKCSPAPKTFCLGNALGRSPKQ